MTKIAVENVNYAYVGNGRSNHVLHDISYEFEGGKFYVIVGKSGCGKTTLLSLLSGLDVPLTGNVTIDGADTLKADCNELRRSKIAVIYQDYNLFPVLNVIENVMYPLRMRKVDKDEAFQEARKNLLAVGLDEEYFKRLPDMLSGGEQQRVAIARALTGQAKIILADEPTGNLDSENSKIVVDIIKGLAHEMDRCVIVVTHDTDIAAQADEVIELSDGRIVNEA